MGPELDAAGCKLWYWEDCQVIEHFTQEIQMNIETASCLSILKFDVLRTMQVDVVRRHLTVLRFFCIFWHFCPTDLLA